MDRSMERPNGLALVLGKRDKLVVSECCQGHSPSCPAGTARWKVFALDAKRGKFKHQLPLAPQVPLARAIAALLGEQTAEAPRRTFKTAVLA